MLKLLLKWCWLPLAIVCLCLTTFSAFAQERPDELLLRNGTTLKGRFVEGDKTTIVFRTEDGIKTFTRTEVAAVFFERDGGKGGDAEFPPGFTAMAPHKIARVIVFRRITQNRALEEGKFEPEVAKISGDGSRIVFFAPKSGLYAINADGSDRRQIWATDGKERTRVAWDRFDVSQDGKVVYWQGGWPIYRSNIDGSDEKLLVRSGAEYEAFRLRERCGRIFFSQRGGIFSIDTEGKGDYREIITPRKLAQLWEIPEERCLLGRFDVSEDGSRIAFVVGGFPKAPAPQLMAINGDGTGLRRIVPTDFDPWALTMRPDGNLILFWKYGQMAYTVNWDGTGLTEAPLPPWDANGSGFQHLNKFSADGRWFSYNGNESGGFGQITGTDGTGRFEPQNCGPWNYYENALFHGIYSPVYSANLRRFVCITQYWRQFKPRQLMVGDINPPTADGIPIISDIEFPQMLSTNPQVPAHRGVLKVRIRKAQSDVERVQFVLSPICQKRPTDPNRWFAGEGWDALQGDHILRDDGKGGDEKAGDGIFTTDNFAPDAGDARPIPGRYLLRIVAHDDQNAVAVDVDGVEIK